MSHAPSAIRLAFDGGWSDGDPGKGRLRFDSPALAKAKHLYVNAQDAQEALLGSLVPTWKHGDVLVLERPGVETNRVVAWIMGPIVHRGAYYKVPVLIRSVSGGFAAQDELALHHYRNAEAADQQPEPAAPLQPVAPVAAVPSDVERRLTAIENRLREAETRLLAPPIAPVVQPLPSAPSPVEIIDNGVMARLDQVEQRMIRFGAAIERLAVELDRRSGEHRQIKAVIARLAIEAMGEDAA